MLFLVGLSPYVNSVNIECIFKIITVNSAKFYSCAFQLFTSESDVNVTWITGSHSSGKSNNDVKGISASSSNVTMLPKGFELFFKNLEVIQFPKANIESLKRSDLSIFPNLRVLNLEGNQIKMLQTFLFDDNLKLEYIYLGANKINFIAEKLFTPNLKLKLIDLSDNVCISKKADIRTMETVKKEMNLKCVDFFELFDSKMSPLANNLDEAQRKNVELLEKVEKLTIEMSEMNKIQEEKVQELKGKLESEKSKLETMTNFNFHLEANISYLKKQLEENAKKYDEMNLPKNDTEDLENLKSNYTDLSENFSALSSKIEANADGIDKIAKEATLTEKISHEKLIKLDQNIKELRKNYEEKSFELISLQQRLNDSLIPASKLQKSDENFSSNNQIYILLVLCSLFTISTLVFLFTTVAGRRKKAYLTHEIDMQGFADSM